jgi:hypothetical protein
MNCVLGPDRRIDRYMHIVHVYIMALTRETIHIQFAPYICVVRWSRLLVTCLVMVQLLHVM